MRKPKKTQYGDYAIWITFEIMGGYNVRLVFAKDLFKSAKDRIGSTPSENADAFVYHVNDRGHSYIFLKPDSTESTVSHECWHIVHRVFKYCGVAEMDDEVVAYHLDYLVEKVYEFKKAIQSRTKKRDKKDDQKSKRRAGGKAASKRRNR